MTIDKGRTWGEPWMPRDGVEVLDAADDAELARLLLPALASPTTGEGPPSSSSAPDIPEVLVHRGDLLRTLGLDGPRPPGQRYRYPIDVGLARLGRAGDEAELAAFVAHLTVRNRRLTGIGPGVSLAVMNAAWLGPLRLGPRAHPNDGLLDVTEGTVGAAQRREANQRARSGSHLPHPRLRVSRVAVWDRRWPRPVSVWLDGVRRGRFDTIVVEVVPDAAAVVA